MKSYFLSSLDSYTFEYVRKCTIIENITNNRMDVAIAEITPSIFINNNEINKIIITNRYENETLFPIKVFPLFVNIALIEFDKIKDGKFSLRELSFIATGELYETEEKAKQHSFE